MSSPMNESPKLQKLGDFEIDREIGRGGMGVVYAARQISLNRQVALKVLSSSTALTGKAVQRFHREAEAAAKLHHSNIVPIYATGEDNGTHFYAMELIEGPSLDQIIRQLRQSQNVIPFATTPKETDHDATPFAATGPFIESSQSSGSGFGLSASSLNSGSSYFDTAARMIAEVADGLDYAHQQGVIHRDIKPSNLLLSPSGKLSINDFGLARILEQPGMTITGEMVGTPRYMSPEQITAGRIPVDHRTDIYSLGATLYELLTLQPPFVAEQRDQLLAQVIQKDPKPPRKVNPKVPLDLETICLKAMDKDPDRRYQKASQMAEDLRRYVNRFAILARRAGPITRIQKWVHRNPALSLALTVILLCIGIAGVLAYQAYRAQRELELSKEQEETLKEKRRLAQEKAILAARLEDFEGSRQAIREAERLGSSSEQIRMLYGQLELYQGHLNEAIYNLKQAVDLLPDSVAGWSMLALAYNTAGRMTEYHRSVGEATRRQPITAEDYLFLGHAQSLLDPDRGLETLAEAIRQRDSALARLIRADATRMVVMNTPEVDKAKLAMEDVQSIRQHLPDSVMILGMSASVHLMAYHVFSQFKEKALQEFALAEGMKDIRALEQFDQSSRGMLMRWVFLDETNQIDDKAAANLQRICNSTKEVNALFNYGQYLYKRGDYQQSVQFLEMNKEAIVCNVVRAFALAELSPDGPARTRKLYEELSAKHPSDWDLYNIQLILRFLGDKKEAAQICEKFLQQPEKFPPLGQETFRRSLEYCAGKRSAEDLIASMGGKRGDLCNVYLTIALTELADGNRDKAKSYLQLGVETRFFEFIPYDLCKMLLVRMNKDPKWPPWIKEKS